MLEKHFCEEGSVISGESVGGCVEATKPESHQWALHTITAAFHLFIICNICIFI